MPTPGRDSGLDATLPGAALIGFAAMCFLLAQGLQPCDDAYITFRHAKHVALAFRPAWNLTGVPVLGSTSPAFVFLLGGLGWIFGAERIESIALVVNGLTLLAVVVLAALVVRDLLGRTLPALLAAALVGFNSVNVFVSSLGFEGTLFSAVLLASLLAVRTRRDVVAAALASAAPLLRPEGLLLTPLVWGVIIGARRLRPAPAVAYLVLPVLWVSFATAYYGSPLPHSVLAKKQTPAVYRPYVAREVDLTKRLRRLPAASVQLAVREIDGILFSSSLGVSRPDLRHRITRWIALLGAIVLAASLSRRRDGRLVYLLYPPAFVLFYGWLGRAEVWYFPSFVTTTLVVAFAGCCHGIALATLRVRAAGRGAEAAATLAVFALFLAANDYAINRGGRADPDKGRLYAEDPRGGSWQAWERERFEGYGRAARLLNQASEEPGPAAISEVGFFGYLYDGPVIDAVGLCSPEALAFYPPPDSDIFDALGRPRSPANTITPTALVLGLAPLYLVSSAIYIPHLLQPDSPFGAEYVELARTGEAWAEPILVFGRADAGGGEGDDVAR